MKVMTKYQRRSLCRALDQNDERAIMAAIDEIVRDRSIRAWARGESAGIRSGAAGCTPESSDGRQRNPYVALS